MFNLFHLDIDIRELGYTSFSFLNQGIHQVTNNASYDARVFLNFAPKSERLEVISTRNNRYAYPMSQPYFLRTR